jgi:hypothetical protein
MTLRLELNRKTLWVYVLAILFAGSLHAQDITGSWQGTITSPQGKPFRMVMQVTHDDSGALKEESTASIERSTSLSNAFAAGVPSAEVVRLPNANHYVFRSNEAEVIHAMNNFLDQLPQP